MFICQLFVVFLLLVGLECNPCQPRAYGDHNIVCVCNTTYCDDLYLASDIAPNQAALYETNKNGARFQLSVLNFSENADPHIPVLSANRSQMFQFILGFGGAFTDAAGINIKSVSPQLQKRIMNSYFSRNGLEYNMGRIPIASCDFSTHPYSYDDVAGDFDLKHFKLTKEDLTLKIPFIKQAMSLSNEQMLLFGSPWSAPAWMKTNNAMNGKGGLKGTPGGKYYKTWANYFIRFLKEYKAYNITFWGLTLQNEPTDGCVVDFSFQSMCFPPEFQRDFLKLDFGPALKKAGFTPENMKVMIGDDDRVILPKWVDKILEDPDAAQYVSGIAFHWYFEDFFPHKILDVTHGRHPDVFYLASEACAGSYPWEFPKVALGNWNRAARYARDIIRDLLNWSIGWIDWNLVLDMQGGPNWVKNYVDAPIIVNVGTDEFYKEPMYYALAQFSKTLPRGSYRIGFKVSPLSSALGSDMDVALFLTPQNQVVAIVVNNQDQNVPLTLHDPHKGFLKIIVSANSIQSYVW